MKILGIDTSGTSASVALSENGRLVGCFSLQHKLAHSETLMPMLENMSGLIDLDMNSIDYIAVTSGPGSFTGLRIGASTAKGLAFGLNKDIIAISTLEVLAYGLYGAHGLICPMLDARRSQVYTALYSFSSENILDNKRELITVKEPSAVSIEEAAENINSVFGEKYAFDKSAFVYLTGDGVEVYLDKLKELIKAPLCTVPLNNNRQLASALCALAEYKVRKGETIKPEALNLEYLRVSQAERMKSGKAD